MPKLRVLANLEFSFELPPGANAEELIRHKERRLLALLRELTAEEARVEGTLESMELESFCTEGEDPEAPSAYYYNRHARAESR